MTGVKNPSAPAIRGVGFGLRWSVAAQVAGTFLRLGSTLILTRFLAPEAYALLGTAMVVLTTLEWLADVGVTPALIRHENGDRPAWLLTGWWISLGRGFALAAATAAMAFPLASFYSQPELAGVVLLLALRPALFALRSPAMPLLRRHLEYRALFVDELAQTAAGAAVGIALAITFPDFGVWALVAGTLAGAFIGVVASYSLAPMLPRWQWDRIAARQLAGFGGAIFVNTLLMAAWLNLDRLAGPRLLPLDVMGLYAVAWNLAAAAEAVVTRGTDVYFSLLARRPEVGREDYHTETAGRIVWFAGPVFAVGIAVAPLAISVLYDTRYQGAAMLLAVLLARLMIRLSGQLDFQLLLAGGRMRSAMAGYAVGAVAQMLLLVALTTGYGAIGLAAATLLSTIVVTAVPAAFARSLDRSALSRLALAMIWALVGLCAATAVHTFVLS